MTDPPVAEGLTVRPARVEDANCLSALSIRVWLHTYAIDGVRPALADYVLSVFDSKAIQRLIQDPAFAVD